jgi:spore coat protein U-like protein
MMKREGALQKNRLVVLSSLFLFLSIIGAPVARAVGVNTLTVTASVLSKNKCKFNTATALLDFGALDPANTVDVTKTTSLQFVCNGSAPIATFAFTSDDGLYETGPGANRMRHSTVTTEYLPYALSLSPATGTAPKGVNQTLTITGQVNALDYRPALVGNYADTVVISLNP